ncbi:hypothetical protein [Halalkalibacillus sediminis]|nr:hypothetical protein [Halalkalibacillus sediminis]
MKKIITFMAIILFAVGLTTADGVYSSDQTVQMEIMGIGKDKNDLGALD